MKNLLLIILMVFASNIYGQKTYNSSVTTTSQGEVIEKQRTIAISDTEATITNFLGGTKTLILKVNDIKEKEYMDKLMKWYYCTSTDKDIMTDKNTEFILIIKKTYPSDITVCQKIDEVTFIKTVFSLK